LPGALARPAGGDPEALVRGHGTVPVVYLVDARTMRISNALEAPDEAFLARQVASSLEEVGGPVIEPPAEAGGDLVDGRFDDFSWSLIEQMAAPWAPPPDPSNAHADDPAAAKLGEALFLDPDLAGNNAVSCATCHAESKGFADALPTAKGVEVGTINTPTALASLNRWFFWDGRADSLWAQALGPLENPSETGGSRLHVAHRVRAAHGASYEAIFGPLPPLDDVSRFPPEGKPGDPAHDAMTPADQEAVARVFVSVGKAIAAYERTLRPPKTRLEAYVAGDTEALSPLERNGLVAFLHSGCVNCHHGPALSDGAFHNVLMPASSGAGDRGRIDGVTSWLASPFRKDGPFSDDPQSGASLAGLTSAPTMLGQMKTPSLRNIARTGPWGHGGTFATLDDVAKHYGQALVSKEKPPRTAGERDAALGGFLGGHNKEIVAFLKVFGE
jgi:cytochrome c peroxidase